MISKSANKFAIIMFDVGAIKQEEVAIYNYLFEYFLENVIYFLFFVVCGVFFKDVLYGLILYMTMAPLRSFGGGVHAPTKRMCYCISYGIVMVITGIVPLIAGRVSRIIWLVLFVFSIIVIVSLAPVDCPNKRLSDNQKNSLRKKCYISIVMLIISNIVLAYFDRYIYCAIITTGTFVAAVSEVLGVIVYQNSKCDPE
ncbi:MAG: accessory gene regulator B family protein [Lachnospiraceae bacterium]|nr:accessory gene regulator B family protein [Lachnospiraceae bacterium]